MISAPATAATPRSQSSGPFPLTEAQEGLWYAQRLDAGNPIFNTGQYLEIRGRFDLDAFRHAVTSALDEADALAVRIIEGADGPKQIIDDAARARLEIIDLTVSADPAGEARAWMQRDMDTPLDLGRDRVACEVLFVLGGEQHWWYQRVHHVAIDGYGTALITARICDLYKARVEGRALGSHAFGSFASVLAEDATYRGSDRRERDRRFWLETFEDPPEVLSLAQGVAPTSRTWHQASADASAAASGLQVIAVRANVPWPDVLVSLVAAYLARHVDRPEVVLGVATMNRLGTPAARVPAMVMNVLPVRIPIDEALSVESFAASASARLRKARRHGAYRSEQLRRDLSLLGGSRRLYGPLVNVLPFDQVPDLPGATAQLHVLGTGPVDDLTITLRADPTASGLRIELDANPTLYDADAVSAHATRLAVFLESAVSAPTVATIPTLTAAEHQRWVFDVNDTAHDVPETTLTALIEASMTRTPHATAVTGDGRTLTYAELDRETARVGNLLAGAGGRRGDVIAVAIPRSVDLVVSLVAILRAGAAYLPLDLEHPAERTRKVLDSACPRTVITTTTLRSRMPSTLPGLPTIAIDDLPNADSTVHEHAAPPQPRDAAYVIYTSGSTGEPKGVVIEHRSIVNRLEWMREHYGIAGDDRILQKTPAAFDVSVWEFFLPLIAGATLVVAPPDAHKDPSWLARIVRDERVTTMHFVPSMLAVFLADSSVVGLRPRRVFVSGEALPPTVRDTFHTVIDAELHNLYGPTEAAVDVTYWDAGEDDRSSPVPIGFPVWNTRMYVLDGRRRPVPPGTAGDLYIAGVQIAREYLGRPDLTSERFVPDPFVPGERMYLTGDRAQWRTDGAIEFLGRSDHQVKIRGLRVELGEIEAALISSPAIQHAVVLLMDDRQQRHAESGDPQIVAYVVPRETEAMLDVTWLRAHVEVKVPAYMVPSAFVVLPALPLTSNGKLNRNALPAPERTSHSSGRAPVTLTERRIADLFARVLGLEAIDAPSAVSADSDFFALGGHSLLAARLMIAIRDALNVDLSLGAMFAHPVVANLAAHIDSLRASTTDGARVITDAEGLGVTIVLSRATADVPTLFCIHPAGGISWCYGRLARALDASATVYGVQARGLEVSAPMPVSLDQMAVDYVDQLLRIQSQGPIHLCGWSVGGIVAHAMAVRLQDLGVQVATLAMFDAYPCDRWRGEAPPDEAAALRALLLIAGFDPAALPGLPLTRDAVVAFLRTSGHLLGHLSDDTLTGVVRVVHHNSRLVREHHHRRFNGDLLYFRAALDHQGEDLHPSEWSPYIGGRLEVVEVPSLHAHLVSADAVAHIAPPLRARLQR